MATEAQKKELIRNDMSNDTPNIVRCKNCEHYVDLSPYYISGECNYFSDYEHTHCTEPNDYCSRGVAKENR